MELNWSGEGKLEVAKNKDGKVIVAVDERYYRPAEVDSLLGDPSLAKSKLGWSIKTSFDELVKEMVDFDLMDAKRESILEKEGYK
jgi:GDP-D-mannose dehydratase